jgi:hypothetical protein
MEQIVNRVLGKNKLLIACLTLFAFTLRGQKDVSVAQEENFGFTVYYKDGKIASSQSQRELDSLYNKYIKKTIEGNSFVLIKYSANWFEASKDKFIDVKRCQQIAE